ncbi:brain tumor -like [Brachionus plicatilis]|uniref:Brain tumor-like n=1 Tax=Brachionus plicatilis TaxID=10195 RepID=A0A3M7QQA0_BRAPC|nr:brain tumor -like [Brachionus plicatilis]
MSRDTLEDNFVVDALKFSGQANLIGALSESSKSLSSNGSSICNRIFAKPMDHKSLHSSNHHESLVCRLCKNRLREPKLLNCLHVFCKMCLAGQSNPDPNIIKCFQCKQETMINPLTGVDDLEDDYVMNNMLDMLAIEERTLGCTSCKSDEKSVARCAECAHFLCPNCVSAHQYMRCFDSHRVVKFEEIKHAYQSNLSRLVVHDESSKSPSSSSPRSSKSSSSASSSSSKMNDEHEPDKRPCKFLIDCGVPIHKPIFCKQHAREGLKFFCITCQTPICSDCVVTSHQQPVHCYERIGDVESRSLEQLDSYIKKARENINYCQSEYQTLDQYLNELNEQSESSKLLIEDTFSAYKLVLENRKNQLIKELEDKHANKQLYLMELHAAIDQCIGKFLDVIKFSDRILRNGNTFEILLLKKSIINQIKHLTSTMPQMDGPDFTLKFVTDEQQFERSVRESFGRFFSHKELKQSYFNSLQCGTQTQPKDPWYRPAQIDQLQDQLKSAQLDDNILKNLSQISSLNVAHGSDEWPASKAQQQLIMNLESLSPNTLGHLAGMSGKQMLLSGLRETSAYEAALPLTMVNQGSSRSHTPATVVSAHPAAGLNSIGSGSSLGSSTASSNINMANNNQVINALDEYLPFHHSCLNSNMAQNLSQLSKLISPGAHELNNLNEMALGLNNYEAASNASQSPPMMSNGAQIGTIGSGMALSGLNTSSCSQATFAGNGNLNPPVRQNGKMANMQIRTKFGVLGSGKTQFNSPHGFCLGIDEEIIVADTNNHRVQVFDKDGEFKHAFGSPGRDEGQLWYPRKVTVMRDSGKFVVCDRGNERSRMQIFSRSGHFLKKISIRYIDIVAGLAVTQNGDIVAVDSVSPTVFRLNENGELKKWFDCSEYMREPSDIAIYGNEYYVCDFKGHCVAVFDDVGNFVRRIGGENITNFPNGIDVSDAGDVLIGDSHGNRFHVAVFSRDGAMISEFECPYVKVSRCCGLKLTSEGYVVTLAKNNHHVLVLNTLYVS